MTWKDYYEKKTTKKNKKKQKCRNDTTVVILLFFLFPASKHLTLSYVLWYHITKTRLYKFDPLEPHFYIVKLGFTGVYIIFLISAQNIDCGYLLEPPRRGGSNEYQQSMLWAEIWKISEFFTWKFSVFGVDFFLYLNRRVFVMIRISVMFHWWGSGLLQGPNTFVILSCIIVKDEISAGRSKMFPCCSSTFVCWLLQLAVVFGIYFFSSPLPFVPRKCGFS